MKSKSFSIKGLALVLLSFGIVTLDAKDSKAANYLENPNSRFEVLESESAFDSVVRSLEKNWCSIEFPKDTKSSIFKGAFKLGDLFYPVQYEMGTIDGKEVSYLIIPGEGRKPTRIIVEDSEKYKDFLLSLEDNLPKDYLEMRENCLTTNALVRREIL